MGHLCAPHHAYSLCQNVSTPYINFHSSAAHSKTSTHTRRHRRTHEDIDGHTKTSTDTQRHRRTHKDIDGHTKTSTHTQRHRRTHKDIDAHRQARLVCFLLDKSSYGVKHSIWIINRLEVSKKKRIFKWIFAARVVVRSLTEKTTSKLYFRLPR